MQMSLAVMPLNISDELRKRKKLDPSSSTSHLPRNAGGPNPALMAKHPLYTNMLEAARQSRGNNQGIF